ncbi:MAG: ABC transporter permease [Alphaproteobacteria bacterium]|nr:ABC transporter permease [Alphaproteobacteria bacterium]
MNIFQGLGNTCFKASQAFGQWVFFVGRALFSVVRPPIYWRQWGKQFFHIAFLSAPVVGLTAIFTGMVLALQSYTGFSRFSAESSIATVVVLSIVRELGPVLTGLMVAGRVGASIAAELGSMRVSDQISALWTMGVSATNYLIVPRLVALVVGMPLLVLCADAIGVFGGWCIARFVLGFNWILYTRETFEFLRIDDVMSGLIKAAVFGLMIASISCYQGYYARGGAQGVGEATTRAVVLSSITVLLMNYVLTSLLFVR